MVACRLALSIVRMPALRSEHAAAMHIHFALFLTSFIHPILFPIILFSAYTVRLMSALCRQASLKPTRRLQLWARPREGVHEEGALAAAAGARGGLLHRRRATRTLSRSRIINEDNQMYCGGALEVGALAAAAKARGGLLHSRRDLVRRRARGEPRRPPHQRRVRRPRLHRRRTRPWRVRLLAALPKGAHVQSRMSPDPEQGPRVRTCSCMCECRLRRDATPHLEEATDVHGGAQQLERIQLLPAAPPLRRGDACTSSTKRQATCADDMSAQRR